MNWLPSTSKGVLIAVAVIAFLYVALNTANLVTIAVGAVVIGLAAYAVYVIGYRIHDALLHGL